MSNSDSDNGEIDVPPKKKLKVLKPEIKQQFHDAWLQDTKFKFWLQKVPDNALKAKCRMCNKEMTPDKSVLIKHAGNAKHIEKCNAVKSVNLRISVFLTETTDLPRNQEVKRAEINIVGFLMEHNISFKVLHLFTEVLKHCITDSKIVEEMALKRTKGTVIATKVISATAKENLAQKFKDTKFSIMSDESTDISTTKWTCIMVRLYNDHARRIVVKFWELSQVLISNFVVSATAERLYDCVISSFDDEEIPSDNIIGFGSDGCNTMMGENNSVSSRLKNEFPGNTIFKCLCHFLAICASEACKQLPRTAEDLARNIFQYFSSSSKRQTEFAKFQQFCAI